MDETGPMSEMAVPPARRTLPDFTLRREELLAAIRMPYRRRWRLVSASGRWTGPLAAAAVVAAIAILMAIVVPQLISDAPGRGHNGRSLAGCTTTVRGVTTASAMLGADYLPPGFRLASGSPSGLGQAGTVTYSLADGRADSPRIQVSLDNYPARLTSGVTGGRRSARIMVGGRPGFLGTGQPDPAFIGVYWKPLARFLISVVGYKVPAAVVVTVAQHVSFRPPGVIPLPISAGHIIGEAAALAIARRSASLPAGPALVKLSSWTEILALIQASGFGHGIFAVPPAIAAVPWRPVWAVLLAPPGGNAVSPSADLVIIAAVAGPTLTIGPGNHPSWFHALSDRNPSLRGCPGGTSARLPFGVLTRDEEAYVVRRMQGPSARALRGETTTYLLKLTTVAALNRADPGLYGGCVQQDCSLDELIWPTISVTRAAPGHTLACLPGSASVPPGYRPRQVKELHSLDVPDNSEVGCGPLPARVARLTDLAPPG